MATANQNKARELQLRGQELAELERTNRVKEQETERHNRDAERRAKINTWVGLAGDVLGVVSSPIKGVGSSIINAKSKDKELKVRKKELAERKKERKERESAGKDKDNVKE